MAADRSRLHRLLVPVVGLLGALFLRALGATWRVTTQGDDPVAAGRLTVGATWHRGLLVMAHYYRDRDLVIMVSRSRDGDFIAATLNRLGYARSPRGSSSRGGALALREQIRLTRAGRFTGVLCDGPRGPARRAGKGVLALARRTHPIQLVAFSARPCLRFGSWDRVILPLPFARVACAYGRIFHVPEDADEAALEETRQQIERELDRLTDELDASLRVRP